MEGFDKAVELYAHSVGVPPEVIYRRIAELNVDFRRNEEQLFELLERVKLERHQEVANYFKESRGYRGAIKVDDKWIGIVDVRRIVLPRPIVRWRGAPSQAIVQAIANPQIGYGRKSDEDTSVQGD